MRIRQGCTQKPSKTLTIDFYCWFISKKYIHHTKGTFYEGCIAKFNQNLPQP